MHVQVCQLNGRTRTCHFHEYTRTCQFQKYARTCHFQENTHTCQFQENTRTCQFQENKAVPSPKSRSSSMSVPTSQWTVMKTVSFSGATGGLELRTTPSGCNPGTNFLLFTLFASVRRSEYYEHVFSSFRCTVNEVFTSRL